jgi:hypothetical protein
MCQGIANTKLLLYHKPRVSCCVCVPMDSDGIPLELRKIALSVWQRQISKQRPKASKQIGDPSQYTDLDEFDKLDLDAEKKAILKVKLLIDSKPKKRISQLLSSTKVLLYIIAGFLLATTLGHCTNSNSVRSWLIWALDVSGYMIMTAGTIYRSRLTNMYQQTVTYTDALVAAIRGQDEKKRPKVQFNTTQVRLVFGVQIAWCVCLMLVGLTSDDSTVDSLGLGADALCVRATNATITTYDWILAGCGAALVGLVVAQWVQFVGRGDRLWWFYAWSMQVLEAGFAVVQNLQIEAGLEDDVAGSSRSFDTSARGLFVPRKRI